MRNSNSSEPRSPARRAGLLAPAAAARRRASGLDDGGDPAVVAAARLISRRDLLVRAGIAGAVASITAASRPGRASADIPDSLEWLLEQVARPALDLLAYETMAGLAVFAVPGPDRFSRAQRLTSATAGGIEAKSPQLLLHTFDTYLSLPDSYLQALAAAFSTGVSDLRLPGTLLGGLFRALELVGATLDDALELLLANDASIPAAIVCALLMNVAATQVRPSAVVGPIASSPFANLTWQEKGQAFQRIEQADPDLVALIDGAAPQPLREGASGLLRFLGNVLLVVAPFAAYSEFGVFDRATRRALRRPVGWDLSNYMPGRTTPADGWPEFIGYYQGRTAVATAPEYAGGA